MRNAKAWEHTRRVCYTTYLMNSTGKRAEITEFMPLFTDPVSEPPQLPNEEERKALVELANKRLQFVPRNN